MLHALHGQHLAYNIHSSTLGPATVVWHVRTGWILPGHGYAFDEAMVVRIKSSIDTKLASRGVVHIALSIRYAAQSKACMGRSAWICD